MSLLFFKRLIAIPMRVGYLVPSSGVQTRRTACLIDFSKPRVIVELGPGEGCHTRQIVRRMNPESRPILIELDDHFAKHLKRQYKHDERVTVVQADALHRVESLQELGITDPDHVVSGIPFTITVRELREELLFNIDSSMGPETVFITYQFPLVISQHRFFDLFRSDHCLFNLPPLQGMQLRKSALALVA